MNPYPNYKDLLVPTIGPAPKATHEKALKATMLSSPLGPMIGIADTVGLHLLEFIDRTNLDLEIEELERKTGLPIIQGSTPPLLSIGKELDQYFKGRLQTWTTPIVYSGTLFQKTVWEELTKIPISSTVSYSDVARFIGKPKAYRSVAHAIAQNHLAIIIPCHRVINASGSYGGYSGGIARKEWLINHETG